MINTASANIAQHVCQAFSFSVMPSQCGCILSVIPFFLISKNTKILIKANYHIIISFCGNPVLLPRPPGAGYTWFLILFTT